MNELSVGSEPILPRAGSEASGAPVEDAVIPGTPEGSPKPPLPGLL